MSARGFKNTELSLLIDELEEVEKKIKSYFEENYFERLRNANLEEVNKIVSEICYLCCDKKGGSRSMPNYIHIRLLGKVSELKHKKGQRRMK